MGKIDKYAEWIESDIGNYGNMIYKHIRRKILDEKDGLLLVEDPKEGQVWINKSGVKYIKYETNKA